MATAPHACPTCGATYKNNLTCETVFHEFLALEFSDAEYGAVHMLTVACYMIQHGQYSRDAIDWIEQRLRDNLEKGIPAEEIRLAARNETSQAERRWKVTRRSGEPPQAKIAWSMSIMDVAAQYQDAASYCSLIRQWAATTLAEMQPLLSKP